MTIYSRRIEANKYFSLHLLLISFVQFTAITGLVVFTHGSSELFICSKGERKAFEKKNDKAVQIAETEGQKISETVLIPLPSFFFFPTY